jgi:hypothetical protein
MAISLYGFTETMRGTWTPLDGSGRKTMWFSAEADASDAGSYLRDGTLTLVGRMHAEGLAENVPAQGKLEMLPLRGRIGYDLSFRGDDGERYRFVGHKSPSLFRLRKTMTTLPGQVLAADGRVVGKAMLYFDLKRDLLPFLATFRRARAPELLPAKVEA